MELVCSGQLVTISNTFTVSGVVTDPTTVHALWRFGTASAIQYAYPSAVNADTALQRDATGVYHFSVTAMSAGTYWVRFQGWTACQAAVEGSFDVQSGRF